MARKHAVIYLHLQETIISANKVCMVTKNKFGKYSTRLEHCLSKLHAMKTYWKVEV